MNWMIKPAHSWGVIRFKARKCHKTTRVIRLEGTRTIKVCNLHRGHPGECNENG